MEKNMKNIKKQFAENGVFYTPKEDAEKLKKYIDIEFDEVYDPTCGQGNLLAVFDDNIKKYGQELDPYELEKAKTLLTNFEGYAGDTLAEDKFKGRQFKLIMANPPFSVKWEQNAEDERFKDCTLAPKSKADWAFNLHIMNHLKEDGQAIVLNFPGTAYRGNAEQKIRKYFIDNNWIDKIVAYPPDTFVDTKISTIVYVFKKNKKTTDVVFIDEEGTERVIKQEDIVKNNYNLSVNTYIERVSEREVIDIVSLNERIRTANVRELNAHLKADLMCARFEGKEEILKHLKMVNEMLDVLTKHTAEIKEEINNDDIK